MPLTNKVAIRLPELYHLCSGGSGTAAAWRHSSRLETQSKRNAFHP